AARVLVAEDETHLAQILCTFLRGRGHHVVCVGDGAAALQAVRREAFDVVLLDIVMPGVDGLDVLAQLRAQPDPPEAIVITGNGTVETAIAAMKLGAYDYMAKPYRMAEIDVLIRRALEKRLLARENRTLHSLLSREDAARARDSPHVRARGPVRRRGHDGARRGGARGGAVRPRRQRRERAGGPSRRVARAWRERDAVHRRSRNAQPPPAGQARARAAAGRLRARRRHAAGGDHRTARDVEHPRSGRPNAD